MVIGMLSSIINGSHKHKIRYYSGDYENDNERFAMTNFIKRLKEYQI